MTQEPAPEDSNRFLRQFLRARQRNEALPPHAGLIVTRPLIEERSPQPQENPS